MKREERKRGKVDGVLANQSLLLGGYTVSLPTFPLPLPHDLSMPEFIGNYIHLVFIFHNLSVTSSTTYENSRKRLYLHEEHICEYTPSLENENIKGKTEETNS